MIKVDKYGNESVVPVSEETKYIYNGRCMASSNLVHNLAGRIHKIECKHCDCFLI